MYIGLMGKRQLGRVQRLRRGLVSYWKMDESSTGVAPVTRNDSFGSNHLTDNGNIASVGGKLGNAAVFVRANSKYLSIANNPTLQTGNIDFTLQAWVYLASKPAGGRMSIINKQDTSVLREYELNYDNGVDRFRFMLGNGVSSVVQVDANNFGSPALTTYYYLLAWYDKTANTINISVNNGAVNSLTMGAVVPGVNTSSFRIGYNPAFGADYFDGRIDECVLTKRLFTANEKADLYNGGTGKILF